MLGSRGPPWAMFAALQTYPCSNIPEWTCWERIALGSVLALLEGDDPGKPWRLLNGPTR